MKKGFAVILATSLALTGCLFVNNGVASNPGTTTTKPGAINPVIKSLTANPTSLSQPGQSISIQVDAYDPKGESLRYTWSATGGTLSTTTGTLVNWKSPNVPATYTVLVLITNDSGGTAAGNLNIQVNSDGSSTVSNSTINNSGSSGTGSNQQSTLDWAIVSPGIPFNDSFFTSYSSGWVVGGTNESGKSTGYVRHTTDGGRTWQAQEVGDRALTSLHFVDQNQGWVGGYNGRLYKTADAGATWTAKSFGRDATVAGLYFTDASKGYLLARGNDNYAYIFTTSDSGDSWTEALKEGTGSPYDHRIDDLINGTLNGALFLAGSYGGNTTKRFLDGGLSPVSPALEFGYVSPALGAPSTLMAILRNSSDLYKSTNGGASWSKQNYQVTNGSIYEERKWAGLAMLSQSEGLGYLGNAIVDSSDGGATWNILTTAEISRNSSPGANYHVRFFGFDRRHGWFSDYSTTGNKQLLRIGSQ